jgi:hypothetical protein
MQPIIRLFQVITSLALLLFLGCAHEPKPHVEIDLSSPKSAAVSYLRAMSAGDLDSLKALTVGTEEQRKPAEAYSILIRGMRQYDQAITAHFGADAIRDDIDLKQKLMEMVDDRIERTEQGAVSELEDSARVSPGLNGKPLRARAPIILKKDKGAWKVDLAATAEQDPTLSPQSAERNQAIGEALLKIAKDINRKRYKSFADMQQDADAGMP